jgi:hypothetical protein
MRGVVASVAFFAASWAVAEPPPDAGVGPSGGRVPSLIFAVVGDTRPSLPDDFSRYPLHMASQIFREIDALSPRPEFVVATGDYMFTTPHKPFERSKAPVQAELYLRAAQEFKGQLFPAMGNHECRNHTNSNCCPTCADGTPAPYEAYLWMLDRLGLPDQVPYYEIHIASSDSARPWTAKLVFIAANAWDDGQAAWLTRALAEPTTYTFVVRHEPDYFNGACLGCGASDAIVNKNPYTVLLTGHDHTFRIIRASHEIVVGLGGAPMDSESDHNGYAVCTQLPDGNISCQERDVGSSTSSYRDSQLIVAPDGRVIH